MFNPSILSDLFHQTWWIFLVLITIYFFKTPSGKGFLGETLVNAILFFSLNKKDYKILKNVYLPAGDGITEIDHIIVSKYGIFVIETKNLNGKIYLSEHRKTWTQYIHGAKYDFQNPLHQNFKHLKSLQEILNVPDNTLFSVVVFTGATLRGDVPENVLYPIELINFIKSHKKIAFSDKEIKDIVDTIQTIRFPNSRQTRRDHIEGIKKSVR